MSVSAFIFAAANQASGKGPFESQSNSQAEQGAIQGGGYGTSIAQGQAAVNSEKDQTNNQAAQGIIQGSQPASLEQAQTALNQASGWKGAQANTQSEQGTIQGTGVWPFGYWPGASLSQAQAAANQASGYGPFGSQTNSQAEQGTIQGGGYGTSIAQGQAASNERGNRRLHSFEAVATKGNRKLLE